MGMGLPQSGNEYEMYTRETNITTEKTAAVDAVELNPTVLGTLANKTQIVVVSATLASSAIQTKIADYPTGFTIDNCVIDGAMAYDGTKYVQHNKNQFASLQTDGIYFYNDQTACYSKTAKITVRKYA